MKYDIDADIKEEIIQSMSLPWKPRPFYSSRAQDTTPGRTIQKNRRSQYVRRFFYHLMDDFGTLVMILATVGLCVLIWGAIAGVLAWVR